MQSKKYKIEELITRDEPWLALVARVSDPQQIDALPAQEKRLLAYAEPKRMPYCYIPFDESAYKGKRAEFKALVIDPILRSRALVIVVFDKIDRFSRDSSSDERGLFSKLLRQGRIELHFPSDNLFIHRDSPAADLFRLDIGVALSGYYASTIRDNVKRRFEEILEQKQEFPGHAPIGYKNIDTGIPRPNSRRNVRDIIPDATRRALIVKGFELRATGMSYEAVTERLQKAGLTSTIKGQPILKCQVEKFLKNPFYAGRMRFNGRVYPHRYEPLIPMWLWRKVQEVRERRAVSRTKYASKEHLYRDFLWCSVCGKTVSTDGPKKDKYSYLKCTEFGHPHGAKWVNEDIINAQVANLALKPLIVPPERIPELLKDLEALDAQDSQYHKRRLRELEAEHRRLDEEIKGMFRERHTFSIRADLFSELVEEKGVRQGEITQEIAAIKSSADAAAFLPTASKLVALCTKAPELFLSPYLSIADKQQLLQMPLSNLAWDGKNINFRYKKTYAAIAACQKDNSWCQLAVKFRTECRQEIMALESQVSDIAASLGI